MYKVLTNNPLARDWWEESESNHMHLTWQEGDFLAVLNAARDLIHLGWRLVNHPLSSSVKPNQTPYKTLVLARGLGLDYRSLNLIEGAIAAAEKFGDFPGGSKKVLADLQFLDLEMCKDIILK
jgi:hypothetical protein